MHKFIDNIIAFSLKNKFFIFFFTVLAVIAGIVSFKHTPIDAFPDVTNTKVTIITQWPGRSAEEMEKFITIPIEIAMNSVQKKTDIRSTTLFGLSVVNVMFEDHVDDFTARQQVYNLLNDADLPEGVTPEVQPLYGPTGEIFRYTLRSEKKSVRELKTIQDWVIERNLRSVSGVADIDITFLYGFKQLQRGNIVIPQLVGIHTDLKGFHLSTETYNIGHTGYGT